MAVYRLPFAAETNGTPWEVGTGNWDDPVHAHGAGGSTDEQAYAWDILHPRGAHILAARAGIVINSDGTKKEVCPPVDAGNFVWIRHADNTVASYNHLRTGTLQVTNGQWVPQGAFIAESGATGNTAPCPNPHLHFDNHSFIDVSGPNPVLGCQLMVHFEDTAHSSFRPKTNDVLGPKSNNVHGDFRQDYWRHCLKCGVLYFAASGTSPCPANGYHIFGGGGNYTLSVDATIALPAHQPGWRQCHRCDSIFFAASEKSVCPAPGGGKHDATSSRAYALANHTQPGQTGWKYCENCAVLWFVSQNSVCPGNAGKAHSTAKSGDYSLHVSAADTQQNWRKCSKCQALFYGPFIAGSKCAGNPSPAGPLTHVNSGSRNYILALDSPDAPGESGWRWCERCQSLFHARSGAPNICPAGSGGHSAALSGDYTAVNFRASNGDGVGEKGWRWCGKCSVLWSGAAGSVCPSDNQAHSVGNSNTFDVQNDSK